MPSDIRDGSPSQSIVESHEGFKSYLEESDSSKRDSRLEMDPRSRQSKSLPMSKEASPARKVLYAFAASQTKRWHAEAHVVRNQDVAQHSWGVAMWISILHPAPSANLLKAALHHDLGERLAGDMPFWAKKYNPEMAAMLARVEEQVLIKHGLQTTACLSEDDRNWLKGSDMLDAWLFLLQNVIVQNYYMQGRLNALTREIRDRWKIGKLPVEIINVMEQVRTVYAWVKIY